MDTLFISDLHLSDGRPDKIELFRQFLNGPARTAKAVYILGDLFENFWVGNDDRTPLAGEVINLLKDCCRHNAQVYIIRGNRDLMLDDGFTTLTGCKLLNDETVVKIDGQATLIMHGDLLCTKDTKYQLFRKFMEAPFIRRLFLSFPYKLRIYLSHGLRPLMKKSSAKKTREIIDVDQATVKATMTRHKITELIHGHTHKPGFHQFELDGQPARRIVLGDWYADASILVCRAGEKKLVRIQDYLQN